VNCSLVKYLLYNNFDIVYGLLMGLFQYDIHHYVPFVFLFVLDLSLLPKYRCGTVYIKK
jgi:hypothetical protein